MLNLKSEDVELFLREDRNVHWFSLKIRGWGTSTASALWPLTTCDRQPVNIAIFHFRVWVLIQNLFR